jgi:hypothetical protein
MNDTVLVTSANPVTFLLEVAKEVKQGYYAYETRECMPHIDIVNEVLLIRGEKPAQRNDFSKVQQVYVQAHNEIAFLQELQDAVLQGFEVDVNAVDISGFSPLFSALLVRPTEAAKAEDTDKAPAPKRTGGRPAKPKEA